MSTQSFCFTFPHWEIVPDSVNSLSVMRHLQGTKSKHQRDSQNSFGNIFKTVCVKGLMPACLKQTNKQIQTFKWIWTFAKRQQTCYANIYYWHCRKSSMQRPRDRRLSSLMILLQQQGKVEKKTHFLKLNVETGTLLFWRRAEEEVHKPLLLFDITLAICIFCSAQNISCDPTSKLCKSTAGREVSCYLA